MSQLPGDGLCGVSQPFLQHVLGTAAPIVAIALALITKGGLFLPLYWDCSGRTALRQLWL